MNNAFRRIGALIPPGNVTVEQEFTRFAPPAVRVHFNRLYRPTVSVDKEGLLAMINSAEQASRGLAQANPEVIVYACTSGSFLSGPGREDEIGEMIRRWTGVSAYTTSSSVIRGLTALQAKRVFMLTPYPEDIHRQEIEFLRFRDIAVDGHQVDDFTESIAKLMTAVVEPEHADAAVKFDSIDAGKRQDDFAQLHPQLARSGLDRLRFDFLDPVDHAQPQCAPGAIEAAEQQYRHFIRIGGNRSVNASPAPFDRLKLHAANLGQSSRVE